MFTIKTHYADKNHQLCSQTQFYSCPNPVVCEYEAGVVVALENGLQIDVKHYSMVIIENMKGHTLARLRYDYVKKHPGTGKKCRVCKLPVGGEHIIDD